MREFLSAHNITFTERNIRQDPRARAELLERVGSLVVPVVVAGVRYVVGYDPESLASLVVSGGERAIAQPPRDSAAVEQGSMAAHPQADLAATVRDLVLRIRDELAYSAAKGTSPYRQGIHDGLRFAEDALVAILGYTESDPDLPATPAQVTQLDA